MCHFVTAVLPAFASCDELDRIAKDHGKQMRPLENESVQLQLRRFEKYALVTTGVCDCGTGLGALVRGKSSTDGGREAEVERLRRKGWTETKIARSLEMKESRLVAQHARSDDVALSDAQNWCEMLMDMLSPSKVPYIGLLLHWYSGTLTSRLELKGRETVARSDISARLLASMKEDVVYDFRAV